MKAKLNKVDNGYVLLVDNIMYATDNDKLSKQNCDEIFGVVDVEKLACKEIKIDIDTYKDIHKKATEKNASPCIPSREGGCVGANLYSQVNGFIKGFDKAMELNKDKVFTRADMIHALTYGVREAKIGRTHSQILEEYRTSHLQQPTEIEVEIVMERIPDGLDESCHIQYAKVPKLDSEGNLILKKL